MRNTARLRGRGVAAQVAGDGIVVVFTLLAFAYSFTRPKVYEASAQMMYSPPANVEIPVPPVQWM